MTRTVLGVSIPTEWKKPLQEMGTSRTVCEALSEVHGWEYDRRSPGPREGTGAVYSITIEVPSGVRDVKRVLRESEYSRHDIDVKRSGRVFVRVSCGEHDGTSERGGGAGPRAKMARRIKRLVEGVLS